ncbi:MAG: cyclic nucleotide-binding domain-containing protein [Mariprofundaceae bacterium]
MALDDSEILCVYRDLHEVFTEDLHIARPLIQMLQQNDKADTARELAMEMARRMLARGRPSDAISFLEIGKLLGHPDQVEIEAMRTMAQITSDGPIDVETGYDKSFMLIDQLSDFEARDFLQHGSLISIDSNTDIVTQGEISRNFYLILKGSIRVHMEANGHHVELSTLLPGHFFGEFACVYQLPRTATVTSKDKCLLLEFSDLAISQLMQRSPIAGERLMQIVQTRLIQSMSYGHPAFTELPEGDRKWLSDESILHEFQDGSVITREGEMAGLCCILVYGKAVAECKSQDDVIRQDMKTTDMFGDVSPQLRLPSNTVIRADGRCLVCCVPKEIFQSFMNAYGQFSYWVEAHGKQRKRALHTAT